MLRGLDLLFLDISVGFFVSQSAGHGLYTYHSLLVFAEKSVHCFLDLSAHLPTNTLAAV